MTGGIDGTGEPSPEGDRMRHDPVAGVAGGAAAAHPHGGGAATVPDAGTGPQGAEPDEAPRAGWLTNLLCGAAVTALGAGCLYTAVGLDLGSLSHPRAGTWPAIVSALLVVLGVLIMVRSPHYTDAERITGNGYRVAAAVAGLVVLAQLIPLVGFEIPSFVLLVAWMSLMERERLRLSVPIAVVTVVVFYLVFVQALAVPLPRLF